MNARSLGVPAPGAARADQGVAERPFGYLPIGLFGSVMGLAGLAGAWRLAAASWPPAELVWPVLAIGAAATFIALCCAYAMKVALAPDAARAEFDHPVACNLFGTVPISCLLLPLTIEPLSLATARTLWIVGAIGMLAFAWLIVRRWLSRRHRFADANPAWIVPVVGLLDIPLALPLLGWPSLMPATIGPLGIGLFFALPLLTIVLARLIFEEPLPEGLRPTVFILLAPFSVAVSSRAAVTGATDLFDASLYAVALFLLCALAGRLRDLQASCPFRVSWWAVSFPLAATAAAGFHVAATFPSASLSLLAWVLLGLATVVIGALFARTVMGIVRGDLRAISA